MKRIFTLLVICAAVAFGVIGCCPSDVIEECPNGECPAPTHLDK